ncbi:MAG TPA: hypothetical protein VGD40_10180 [Chryseosolibacter sp.]
MKKTLSFFFLLLSSLVAVGQTVLENNPPSLRWYQVNTPHFRVIFPKGYEAQGQRVANTLEHIHDEEAKSLGSSPRKISVILQNQSSIANGFVSVLPRRSEFYGMPPQDYNYLGNTDWLDLLSSHEYRHIVQYQHAFRGFNKAFYYLFGSAGFAGMAQAAAPMWFWEGDAVATETAFTATGRGRIPNFSLLFRTNLLEGRTFNYHKQYLRSYKHAIPDHYVLGYHLVSYLRQRTNDPEIWGKISKRAWTVPFIPFAFSNAIKKETGMHVTSLYNQMAVDFKKRWEEDLNKIQLTPFENVAGRPNSAYTDYLYPQAMDDGTIIAMKTGIGDIQTFVSIKDGKEKKIFRPGFVNDAGMLSLAGETLVWTEYGYHPRFLVKNYSLIKSINTKKRKVHVIGSRQQRYGSAAISPDGSKVVAIETTTDYKTSIHILDAGAETLVKKFDNPQNHFYSMPRWSSDGSQIVVLKTSNGKKTISIIDYATGIETDITEPSDENFGHPIVFGDYVLYNSPSNGIDNIYAIHRTTKERFQITVSRFGAYNPSIPPNGKYIYYNEQSKNGMDIVRVEFDPTRWTRVAQQQDQVGPTYAQTLIEQEGHPEFLTNTPVQSLPVKKYSKLKGIINPYSWGPYVESDLTQANIGIMSRDLLSTTAIDLGYTFDINERTGAYRASVSYQGLFPILDLSVIHANRDVLQGNHTYARRIGGDTVYRTQPLRFKYNETTVQGGLRVPLLLTRSKYYAEMSIASNVGYTRVTNFRNSITGGGRLLPSEDLGDSSIYFGHIENGNLIYNHFELTATHLLKQSRRDINSKWGQTLFINAYVTPWSTDFTGRQFSGYSVLYFPGLFNHHSLWGYGGYQYTALNLDRNPDGRLENYTFRTQIPTPRGLGLLGRVENLYTTSANYTLPIWYPDVAIGPLLNIQRFRANGFVDYAYLQSDIQRFKTHYATAGIELRADLNILRFYPQFDLGVRFITGIKPALTRFEVLIGTFNF